MCESTKESAVSKTQKIELDKLHIAITRAEEATTYIFSGHLNESFDQRRIPTASTRLVHFDLAGIEYVSSVGIREWVMLVNHWSSQHQLQFHRCSIYFVDQMNMVPDCLGSATVHSVYAPYYRECETCSGEQSRLIELGSAPSSAQSFKIPELQCEQCEQQLEFDALDESYFSFLNHVKPSHRSQS